MLTHFSWVYISNTDKIYEISVRKIVLSFSGQKVKIVESGIMSVQV